MWIKNAARDQGRGVSAPRSHASGPPLQAGGFSALTGVAICAAELLEGFADAAVKSFLVHDRFPSKLRKLHRQRAPSEPTLTAHLAESDLLRGSSKATLRS